MRLLLTTIAMLVIGTAWTQPAGNPDYFAEGKKAQTAKNYTLAIENFEKVTTQRADAGEAWYELGWCYNELAKYSDAIKSLENAKTYWKSQAKVYYESGYAYDFAGLIDKAVSDYLKCIELSSSYAGAYRQLANIYFDVDKDYKNALKYYSQYIDYSLESEISSKTWHKKGFSENELGEYEDAVMSLNKSVALDDKYAAAYNELGYAYYKLSQADEAIEAYTASQKLEPNSSAACSGLGDVYRFLKKNPDEAFNYYKKGVEINPKSHNSNYGVGWCYNEKADYASAIPYLQKAIEFNNKYSFSLTELGYAYYGLKRYDEALVELDKSIKLLESGVPYYYCGLCYIAKNQKTKAQEVYKKLTDLNSPDAATLLTKINAMQ